MGVSAERSYKLALVTAALSLLLAIISISTPSWTVLDGKTIGLWVLNADGIEYSWTEQWGQDEGSQHE